MKTKYFYLSMFLAASIDFASCSEDLSDGGNKNQQTLKIEVADASLGSATTRATYSGYTTTFANGDQIGLYVVKGTRVVNANVLYEFNGTDWTTDADVEYNSGYTYYAYFPYVASPYTPDFTQSTVDDKFDSFINDASNKFHNANQSTKANFQASDFMLAQGTTGGSPNTITFSMYHKKGLAVFNGEGAADATFTGNIPYLMSDTKYFLMKPSTNTEFTDDESTYTLNASSGHYVTHSISEAYNTFVLTVTGPSAYTYAGGTNSYSVTSYKQNSAGTKTKAAAWAVSYDTDGDGVFNDSKPSWLTTFTASGDGGTSASPYDATVAAQTAMTPSSGTASSILAAATPVSDYDLSDPTGVGSPQNTANCYMVHAPGTYKLPLVYGNAIKNGSSNSNAYNPSGTSSNTFLKPFINHAGAGITDPYLKNNSATPDGVSLVWQDVNGLIKNGSLAIDGDYLKFEIQAATIAEGNAVIAATKSGTIVWTWHIWVTPETYSNLTAVNGYSVTPVNLGWVGSSNVTKSGYEGRSCNVKVTQSGGGQTQTFTITQSPNITVTPSKGGYSPYYQWGRMTPEIPSTGTNNSNHAAYNISGSSVSMVQKTFTSTGTSEAYGNIENGIKYPLNHYYNNISGNSGRYGPFQSWQYNLWDAACTAVSNNRTNHSVKTVYDPCPPGFCVPSSGLIYYITNTVNTSVWDGTNQGRTWNSTLWLPAAGCRSSSSGATPSGVGSYGYYWSATPNSEGNGYYLYFNSSYWSEDNYNRANGFSVRPVAE